MKDIHISWDDYHKKIEQLAKKVHDDNLKFNQIICIAKGTLNNRLKTSPTLKPPFAIQMT